MFRCFAVKIKNLSMKIFTMQCSRSFSKLSFLLSSKLRRSNNLQAQSTTTLLSQLKIVSKLKCNKKVVWAFSSQRRAVSRVKKNLKTFRKILKNSHRRLKKKLLIYRPVLCFSRLPNLISWIKRILIKSKKSNKASLNMKNWTQRCCLN